jgi:hypothetical protein
MGLRLRSNAAHNLAVEGQRPGPVAGMCCLVRYCDLICVTSLEKYAGPV